MKKPNQSIQPKDQYAVATPGQPASSQAQAELRESQALYHSFVDQLPAAAFRKDREGRYVMVNPRFCRLKGVKAEEFLGRTAMEVAALQTAKQEREGQAIKYAALGDDVHKQIIQTGKPIETEEEYIDADGGKHFFHVVRMPVFGLDQTVIGSQGILFDVTARKRAEAAMMESRNFLDKIINSVADPVLVKDQQHRWVLLNDAYCNFMGHQRNELLGKSDYDFFPKSEADVFRAKDEVVFSTGTENISEEKFTDAKGMVHTIVTKKTLYADDKGAKFIVGVIRDITERELAETELHLIQTGLNQVGFTIFRSLPDARIISVNDAACRNLGYTREELCRMTILDIDLTFDQKQWETHRQELKIRGTRTFEGTHRRKDGTTFPVEVTVYYLEKEGEEHSISFARDITERKQAEAALGESQALYTSLVEQMPAGVFRKDREGRYVLVNSWFCHLRELKAEEILGKTPEELIAVELEKYGDTRPEITQLLTQGTKHHERIMRTGEQIEVEEEYPAVGGRKRYLRVVKSPVFSPDGQIVGTQGILFDITERKQAESALQESQALYHSLVEQMPAGVFRKDREGCYVFVNSWFCRLWNTKAEEVLGKTSEERLSMEMARHGDIPPESISALEAGTKHHEQIMRTGEPIVVEEEYPVDGGGKRHVHVVKSPVFAPDGRIIGTQGIQFDVTELKRAEEALERLAAIVNSSDDAIISKTLDGIITSWNPGAEKLFGYSAAEAIGQPMLMLFAPDRVNEEEELLARIGRGESVEHFETVRIRKDGKRIDVSATLSPITDNDGKVIGASKIARDITERKRAEQQLKDAFDFNQTMLHASPVGIVVYKDSGQCISANEALAKLIGGTVEKILKQNFRELEPWKHSGLFAAAEAALATQSERELEPQLVTTFGKKVCLSYRLVPFHYAGEVHLLVLVTDISERRLAEERIREQAALLDAATDAIYVCNLDNTVTYWNDGAEYLYGWKRSEVLGRKVYELVSYNPDEFNNAQKELLAKGFLSGELKVAGKADKELTTFCRWTMLRDEAGRPKEILAINTDITEKKQLEANFLRAQRMEGIGALAGGIAHDLNNILQPILIAVPFLRETIGDPENRSLLDTVENSAQRGADIIKQLLTFARGTPGVRVPLPVRHLMNDIDKIIRETFPRNIKVNVDAPKDLWPVLGDATQIHQALMNLCVNARDAMPSGGELALAAKNLTLDETFTSMIHDAKPGTYVCVSVIDTGTGIPPELLDHIFEPFFTTKEVGKGTGLGLATVLGIVRGHGGFIRVDSRLGHGTTFELYLPASPQAKADEKSACETLPPEMHGELVLVVDDEAHVREVIQQLLEKHGYRVATAAEGSEAMKFFTQHRAEIKAVVTDLMMPGMDGAALIRALRHLDPRLPILIMTGMGEQTDIKGIQSLGLPVLLKPFVRGELLTALYQAITAAEPR
ncbi:MAG: PAS domain S-box protein [Verrucomicrobiota bacterium]